MKKSLVALAALAVVGVASAQSSVTLYGVADFSVGKISENSGLGLSNDSVQFISSNVLNNGNSRFGLRGVEDLGGGLKAGFNFEAGVVLGTGAGNTSGGQLFSRAANMSLMGGFGEFRGGRTLTTSYNSVAAWELTGTANYSAVARRFDFAGAGPRDSNVLMYNSPDFGGIKFSASTVLKGNDVAEKAKYDLAVTYAAGPIAASLAYNKVKDGNEGAALGAKYNFGMFQVAGSLQRNENTAGDTLREGATLGASATLGPVVLTADFARDSANNVNTTLVEVKYPLSKRTFAYGVLMRDDFRSSGDDVNGYALGLRHNF